MRIAIVPQLVPVAKDVSEATINTRAGNQSGDTTSLSKDEIYCPVINLSQLALIPHAHNIITIGSSAPESPSTTVLPIAENDIFEHKRAQIIEATKEVIAAVASIFTLLAFESASLQEISEKIDPLPFPSIHNPPSIKLNSRINGINADNIWILSFSKSLSTLMPPMTFASGSDTFPVSRARFCARPISP